MNYPYQILATEILTEVTSNESKNLNSLKLKTLLSLCFENEQIINILRSKDNIFNMLYENHINGKYDFENIKDPIDCIALSWLMYLYH